MEDKEKSEITLEQAEQILNLVTDQQLAKASAIGSLVVQESLAFGGGVISPKNTADWLALYTKHVWTYVAVYAVANTIAKLHIQLWKRDKKTGAIENIDSHSILDVLEHPNSDMTGYDLKESLVTYLELAGNAYWELVYGTTKLTSEGNTISSNREPVEIFNIRPDRLIPKPRKDGKGIEAWIFQTKKGFKKTEMKPKQVTSFSYFNPIQDWFGLGSVTPAKDEVMQDLHMIAWNDGFFEDGLMPQGILTTDQPITKTKMEDMAAQLKQFLIGKGRKVMILGNNMKWQTVSVKPADADFLQGRKENKLSVLGSVGVPPSLAGMLDHAKFDNYALQLESFHKDTILPKLKKIESALFNHFIPRFPDLVPTDEFEWLLLFDVTDLIQEDKDRLTDRIVKQISNMLLTPNEGRKMLSYEPYPEGFVGGDDFYMPTNVQPVTKGLSEEGLERAEDDLNKRIVQLESEIVGELSIMKSDIKKDILDEQDIESSKGEIRKELEQFGNTLLEQLAITRQEIEQTLRKEIEEATRSLVRTS